MSNDFMLPKNATCIGSMLILLITFVILWVLKIGKYNINVKRNKII